MLTSRQLLALALLSLFAVGDLCGAIPKLDIIGRNFKLNWLYQFERTVEGQDGAAQRLIEVEEIHSGQQRRSILRFFRHESESFRSTYYSSDQQVVVVNEGTSECESVGHDHLEELYNGIPEDLFDGEQKYMIGAGKLLALVAKQAKKFEERASTHKYNVFQGVFRVQGRDVRINLFYSKDRPKDPNRVLPQVLQIGINSKEACQVSYGLTQFQLLDDGFQSTTSAAASSDQYGDYNPNGVVYDLFAFERAIGCHKVLNSLSDSISERLANREVGRFSFETQLNGATSDVDHEDAMEKASVVYEPALSSLRVHQSGRSGQLNSILNFNADRRFHAIRRRPSADEAAKLSPNEVLRRESSSCVQTLIKDAPTHEHREPPFSLGRILLGTEKLHYVGLARVRGIEARAYQWHGSDWPVWLQPPMVYKNQADLANKTFSENDYGRDFVFLRWRNNVEAMKRADISMTSVFYFGKVAPTEDEILDAKLLLVELIIRGDDLRGEWQPKKFSLPIYDFTWDLPDVGPDGGRYENSISLRDDCLADSETHSHGTIQMALEVSAASKKDLLWLRERNKRNVAILQLMQERFFFVAMSIVQDIDSRLTIKSETSASISAVMRAAKRSSELTEVLFHCRLNPASDQFEAVSGINFDACLMTVAHKREQSVFAHDGEFCYLLRPELANRDSFDKLIGNICRLPQQGGRAELYQIKKRLETDRYIHPLDYAERSQNLTSEKFIGDPSTKSLDNVKVKLTFVDTSLTNNRKKTKESVDRTVDDANKFLGFGLVPSDAQNKLVELKGQVMSFEACQTACIGYLGCRSFSVCISNGQMKCIMSTVSFRAPSLVDQLRELQETKSKLNEKFTLKVEPNEQTSKETPASESIQVVRHPNCELHNKLHLDYFRDEQSKVQYTGGNPLFRPMPNMEKCAELCLEKTLAFLRNISQIEASTGKLIADRHQLITSGICMHINYVRRQNFERDFKDPQGLDLTAELEQILAKLAKMEHAEEVDGFCVLDNYNDESQFGPDEIHVTHSVLRNIWFTTYVFDFLKLFEKWDGISLVESELAYSERVKIKNEIERAIEHGEPVEYPKENLGWTEPNRYSPQHCADSCLRSASSNPLGCRSFEYIEIDSPSRQTQKFCTFNTVTLKSTIEANKTNFIKYDANVQTRVKVNPADKVRVSHFEPRAGLFSESLDKLYLVSSVREDSSSLSAKTGARFGVPTLVFVAIILLVLGTMFGLVLGAKHIRIKRREEADELVEDGPDEREGTQMTFANIVAG